MEIIMEVILQCNGGKCGNYVKTEKKLHNIIKTRL